MSTNKEQASESNTKGNYEAAVLDFLDKEMAAIQPDKKQNESGQEVDELVTDLLKQVMTEADEPCDEVQTVSKSLEAILAEDTPFEIPPLIGDEVQTVSKSLEAILAEDAPFEIPPLIDEKKEAPPDAAKLGSPEKTASGSEEDKKCPSKEEPSQESSKNEPFRPRIPNLALGLAPRRKFPLIAVASVCLVVAIGVAVLYLWGSSGNPADSRQFQPDAATSLALEYANMNPSATLQQLNTAAAESSSPAWNGAALQQTPPQPDTIVPSAGSSDSVPAAPAQNAAAPKLKPVTPASAKPSARAASETTPELPQVEFLTAQISAPSPLTTESNLNIDRSATPPMPDAIALANSALDRNPGLISPSHASDPAGSRNLVPSILISQVNPVYPELAIRSRTSGSVVLELQIDNEGTVVKATPVSGPSVFYSEAVKAAMQYRYRPATFDGRNVSSKSSVTMVFNYNR